MQHMLINMNIEIVEQQTIALFNQGCKLLHIHRFDSDDELHIGKLLSWADFPYKAKIADLGSGVGEVAKLMQQERIDLSFYLVNISKLQLDLSPEWMTKINASFCAVPIDDEYFDAAMFVFSIGHEDIKTSLKEAYRLLKKNGVLFIYDMIRESGDNSSMAEVEYQVLGKEDFKKQVQDSGFSIDLYAEPFDDGEYEKKLFGSRIDVFKGVRPVIWRLVK